MLVLAGCSRAHRHAIAAGASARPPQPNVPASGSGLWYRIRSGDTLSSISRRSGLSVEGIVAANRLESNLIKPGQVLWLPGAAEMQRDPLRSEWQNPSAAGPIAVSGEYLLIRRREWTKRKVGGNHRAMSGIRRITVHHTGEHKGMAEMGDRELIQRIEHFHTQTRGWSAIGYHYIIGRDGRVYEGRPAGIQGAHVARHNAHNLGVSLVGDFQKHRPSDRQLAVLEHFLDDQRRRYKVGRQSVHGHRDLGPTICPGKHLYHWLNNWKRG